MFPKDVPADNGRAGTSVTYRAIPRSIRYMQTRGMFCVEPLKGRTLIQDGTPRCGRAEMTTGKGQERLQICPGRRGLSCFRIVYCIRLYFCFVYINVWKKLYDPTDELQQDIS